MKKEFKQNFIFSVKIGFLLGLAIILIFFVLVYLDPFHMSATDVENYILPFAIFFMQPAIITDLIGNLFNLNPHAVSYELINLFIFPITYAVIFGLGYYLINRLKK